MAMILKTDGSWQTVEPKNHKDFKLEELNTIVGGYIEVVYLKNEMILVINEEGKIHRLPINPRATQYYWDGKPNGDYIVGDVLYCKQSEVK